MAQVSRLEFLVMLALSSFSGRASAQTPAPSGPTVQDVLNAERIAGITLDEASRAQVLNEVRDQAAGYKAVHALELPDGGVPPLAFGPLDRGSKPGSRVSAKSIVKTPKRSGMTDEDLAFSSVGELGALLRSRQVTSVELTEIYLKRIKQFGPKLECIITITEERALAAARKADAELTAGKDRGPLHGIPYGLKDLFAVKGTKTTWGAEPYRDQVLDYDAAVVEHLDAAGAVLVAKTTLGALAMGDVWYGGVTKNPWNLKQGSSGSSAGSASGMAAALFAFAIGTETLGSIVSPSVRCRVTGLRPTFGRISRHGAMALSYTMDKVGPICRYVEDCALVLAALAGADPRDPSSVDRPFLYPARSNKKVRVVGYLPSGNNDRANWEKDEAVLALRAKGVEVKLATFKTKFDGLLTILDAECGAAFDKLTRSPDIAKLKNSSWPITFRGARFIPVVEYLSAQRAREVMMRAFEEEIAPYDAVLGQGTHGLLVHTNLTGHPQLVIPMKDGTCRSLVGRLYREDQLLALGQIVESAAGGARLRPPLN